MTGHDTYSSDTWQSFLEELDVWRSLPFADLAAHIAGDHREQLFDALHALRAHAARALEGSSAPDHQQLAAALDRLQDTLDAHLLDEERLVLQTMGHCDDLTDPFAVLDAEQTHESLLEQATQVCVAIRQAGTGDRWQDAGRWAAAFRRLLIWHLVLQESVLFPRMLDAADE